MSDKPDLRVGKKGDEKEIKILVATVLGYYGIKTDSHTDEDIEDIEKFYLKNKGTFKVLTHKDKIIGSYGVYYLNDNDCELRKMYLYKEYQGKGHGKLMLKDSFEEAKKLKFSRMTLETNGKLKKSLGMYKKYGFTFYKPKKMHAAPGRAELAMEKSLIEKKK